MKDGYDCDEELYEVQAESEKPCDHIVAIVAELDTDWVPKIKMIRRTEYQDKKYSKEFTFCPDCGAGINWIELWEKIGIIKKCEQCNRITSFERRDESYPPEGDRCIECDDWICKECTDWGETGDAGAICKKCTKGR